LTLDEFQELAPPFEAAFQQTLVQPAGLKVKTHVKAGGSMNHNQTLAWISG
jgi:hypothetical protein